MPTSDVTGQPYQGQMINGAMGTPPPMGSIGQATAGAMGSMSGNMYQGGYGGSGDDEDYDNEPPLLEELGINFEHIYGKTVSVLHPTRLMNEEVINDCDMAGPLCFVLTLGATLMLRGKLHFGYIYGISIIGSVVMYGLLNLMCPRGIDIYRTTSVLGYCLLPMVIFSALAVVISMQGAVGLVFGPLSIGWCSYSAAAMFVAILHDDDQKWLIRYPVCLLYTTFALITVF